MRINKQGTLIYPSGVPSSPTDFGALSPEDIAQAISDAAANDPGYSGPGGYGPSGGGASEGAGGVDGSVGDGYGGGD